MGLRILRIFVVCYHPEKRLPIQPFHSIPHTPQRRELRRPASLSLPGRPAAWRFGLAPRFPALREAVEAG